MYLLQPHRCSPAGPGRASAARLGVATAATATSGGRKAQERSFFNLCNDIEVLMFEMMLWVSLDNERCLVLVMEGDVFQGFIYVFPKLFQEKKKEHWVQERVPNIHALKM